jgi:hypothetical protein
MPLIELKTDLKSLNFGGDRPGGGNSNQPFIRVPIPPQESSTTDAIPSSIGTGTFGLGSGPLLNTLSDLATGEITNLTGLGNNDIIIRGGASSITRSAIDAVRITRYLSSPEGLLFIAKQNQLSKSGVRTQGSGKNNDLSYSGTSTLGQAAGNAFGLHLLKQSKDNPNTEGFLGQITDQFTGVLTGTRYEPKPDRYLDNVDPRRNNDLNTDNNRLVTLKNAIDTNTSTTINDIILNNNGNILSYPGGPSTFGISGETNIKFSDPFQRTGKLNPNLIKSGFFEEGTTVSNPTVIPMDVANGASSFLKEKAQGLGEKARGFLGGIGGKIGGLIGQVSNRAIDIGLGQLDKVLTVENIFAPEDTDVILGNFTVFKHQRPSQNYNRYIGLSNIYGDITSTPGEFNEKSNAIRPDGNRDNVHDNSVYQGANITNTNPEIQNANFGATLTQRNINDLQKFQTARNESQARNISDFRKTITRERGKNNVKKVISSAPNYKTKNIHFRVNLGDPGSQANTTEGIFNYGIAANALKALDKINAMPAYDTNSAPNTAEDPVNDLISLRFRILNPGGTSTILHFRSFIDSFSDNFSSKWNSTQYVGRAENFYNYGGFDRQIALGFTVAVQSKAELIPVYRKLNHLASTLAPEYSEDGFMKGTLIKLTYGGYLFETPGFLTAVNYTIPENSPYEIAIDADGSGDTSVTELPLMVKVSVNFTPIHNFLVEKANSNTNPNAKYISLQNSTKKSMYADAYDELAKDNPPEAAIVENVTLAQTDLAEDIRSINPINASDLDLEKVSLPPATLAVNPGTIIPSTIGGFGIDASIPCSVDFPPLSSQIEEQVSEMTRKEKRARKRADKNSWREFRRDIPLNREGSQGIIDELQSVPTDQNIPGDFGGLG